MARKSLVNVVADALLDRIVAGELDVGAALPSEAEIGEEFEVSRVTVREALRVLTAQGVVQVASGIGSSVRPIDEWRSIDALVRYRSAHADDGDVAVQLIAVRRMFETEAAALAATRLSDEALVELDGCIDGMRDASARGDVDAFVAADLRFHDVIMRGSGNIFLAALFDPITRVLAERRAETSRVPEIQSHAIAEHRRVLEALRARDEAAARTAMDLHMQQTLDDLTHYVLGRD
ncbi:FadR/GntR family transcriptional regulator [Microbacterium sp. No. 7]|uniref:FadR/GntR family transcriptional regulator n=1 Tax=Microbacterium sp. No. 7 TaxID=1714373 RepID=UPI0006D2AD83|nr:FadR/GntR family transcriptional regulator [Microbacterium sp. No. 7]ALJ19873.1 GntR family transcriptional regulator [Microbacterium sp. No. 7]